MSSNDHCKEYAYSSIFDRTLKTQSGDACQDDLSIYSVLRITVA